MTILIDDEFVCPLCGLILTSLTEFHRHVARIHGGEKGEQTKGPDRSRGQVAACRCRLGESHLDRAENLGRRRHHRNGDGHGLGVGQRETFGCGQAGGDVGDAVRDCRGQAGGRIERYDSLGVVVARQGGWRHGAAERCAELVKAKNAGCNLLAEGSESYWTCCGHGIGSFRELDSDFTKDGRLVFFHELAQKADNNPVLLDDFLKLVVLDLPGLIGIVMVGHAVSPEEIVHPNWGNG